MILNFEIRRRNWLSFRPNEFDLFLRCWHGHLVSSFHCFCFWCDTLQGLIWLVDCTAGVHGLSLKASRVYVVSLFFFCFIYSVTYLDQGYMEIKISDIDIFCWEFMYKWALDFQWGHFRMMVLFDMTGSAWCLPQNSTSNNLKKNLIKQK